MPPSADNAVTLTGERVTLRPGVEADVEILAAQAAEPEVAFWWGVTTADDFRRGLDTGFVILSGGSVCGWLHFGEETEPSYAHVVFDIFVSASAIGHGLGSEALRLAARHFIDRGHRRFTMDPAADNDRAIRAYEAVGFKPVGRLREYERLPDGRLRDGLLMELLARELR